MLEFLEYDHDWNNYQYDTTEKLDKACALMEEAGVGFVRITFAWSDIEPEAGRFDFDKFDRIVAALGRHHLKILALLAFNAPAHGGDWNSPPDAAAYVNYARTLARRYKDRIRYWEVWNEPDMRMYWTDQDDQKAYSLLLKAVYPALKQKDPTCRVLVGGLMVPYSLRRIYQNGGHGFFDIVNLHPYTNPLRPEALDSKQGMYAMARKVMEQNGDGDKAIWFTEIGCPGLPAGVTGKGWWEGKSPSEAEQAKWVTTVMSEPLRWQGVEKVFWSGLRDTIDSFHNDIDYFGLLRNDFSKKPGFDAYRRASHAKYKNK